MVSKIFKVLLGLAIWTAIVSGGLFMIAVLCAVIRATGIQ